VGISVSRSEEFQLSAIISGLNAVMAVHTPKQMTDGNWKVALYLDNRATPEPVICCRWSLRRWSVWTGRIRPSSLILC